MDAEEVESWCATARARFVDRAGAEGLLELYGVDAKAVDVQLGKHLLGRPGIADCLVTEKEWLTEPIAANAGGLVIDDTCVAHRMCDEVDAAGPRDVDDFDILRLGPVGEGDVVVDFECAQRDLEWPFDDWRVLVAEDGPLVIGEGRANTVVFEDLECRGQRAVFVWRRGVLGEVAGDYVVLRGLVGATE